MEIKEVCFRGRRDGVWDELNVDDNNREREKQGKHPDLCLVTGWTEMEEIRGGEGLRAGHNWNLRTLLGQADARCVEGHVAWSPGEESALEQ